MKNLKFTALAAAAVLAISIGSFSQQAEAALVTTTQVEFSPGNFTWPGQDCSGTFGTGSNCAYNGSPIIAKFNTPFDFSDPEQTELNTAFFPGLQASWFTLTGTTWQYDPQGAGPGITAFAVKAGQSFFVYEIDGGPYYGGNQVFTFATPLNQSGRPADLSHISFYNSTTVIPVPGALPLMLSGLVGFGLLARRRRSTN